MLNFFSGEIIDISRKSSYLLRPIFQCVDNSGGIFLSFSDLPAFFWRGRGKSAKKAVKKAQNFEPKTRSRFTRRLEKWKVCGAYRFDPSETVTHFLPSFVLEKIPRIPLAELSVVIIDFGTFSCFHGPPIYFTDQLHSFLKVERDMISIPILEQIHCWIAMSLLLSVDWSNISE